MAEESISKFIPLWDRLVGEWTGTCRLWLSREEPESTCPSSATLVISEDRRRVELEYGWLHDGRPQICVMKTILRGDGRAEMRWSDSFHTSSHPLKLKGTVVPTGLVSVRGTYAAPPEDDWGWRIDMDPTGVRTLRVTMYNVSPEGKEELAVEAIYKRRV